MKTHITHGKLGQYSSAHQPSLWLIARIVQFGWLVWWREGEAGSTPAKLTESEKFHPAFPEYISPLPHTARKIVIFEIKKR